MTFSLASFGLGVLAGIFLGIIGMVTTFAMSFKINL